MRTMQSYWGGMGAIAEPAARSARLTAGIGIIGIGAALTGKGGDQFSPSKLGALEFAGTTTAADANRRSASYPIRPAFAWLIDSIQSSSHADDP